MSSAAHLRHQLIANVSAPMIDMLSAVRCFITPWKKESIHTDFVNILRNVTHGDILIASQLCEVSARRSLMGAKSRKP